MAVIVGQFSSRRNILTRARPYKGKSRRSLESIQKLWAGPHRKASLSGSNCKTSPGFFAAQSNARAQAVRSRSNSFNPANCAAQSDGGGVYVPFARGLLPTRKFIPPLLL